MSPDDAQPTPIRVALVDDQALIRSGLWTDGDSSADLPSIGDMLKEITAGEFDGARYDAEWPERAKQTMW